MNLIDPVPARRKQGDARLETLLTKHLTLDDVPRARDFVLEQFDKI